jgi:hypothetical protein
MARGITGPFETPRGSRNKLGEDFAKHGPAVIEKVRTNKPDTYRGEPSKSIRVTITK